MTSQIPEADWRQSRRVHELLLERYCAHILDEITEVANATAATAHDRYLRIARLIEDRDKDLAQAFDDFKRSTAVMKLAIMRRMGLLTDEEMMAFSKQIQDKIRGISPAASREYTD